MCSGGQEAWCSTVCVQEGRRPGVVLYVFRGQEAWWRTCVCSGSQQWKLIVVLVCPICELFWFSVVLFAVGTTYEASEEMCRFSFCFPSMP